MPLKPAVSANARQTIKHAFDQLERTITPEDSREFSATTLEDVRRTALNIENQLASRKSLRNMRRLVPLFNGLEHYAKVVDVLCNGTPYLPWIWAPITLILRISCEYVEAFEKIIKGYARIADSLKRFQTLNQALKTNMDFQTTLATFYADILQFHTHAYEFVCRKSWQLLFLTSWGRFERKFDNILEHMKRHEKLVDLQASAISVSEIRAMHEDINSWREESTAKVCLQNEKQTIKEYESIIAWLKSEESDQLALLDTISAEGARFVGTASWALKNPKIKSWLQQKPDQCVLWLHGTPGSGKSVLASQIVKFMRSANMFLIHHFCSQRYSSSTSYEQILRSILLQLIRKDDELVAHVYADCVLGKRPPTIQALEKLLLNLFSIASRDPRQIGYIWIIIDGLNECETRRQLSIVNLINQITSKIAAIGDTICKVLISSRHSLQIATKLKKKQVISLTEEKRNMKLAIRQYVSQRLRFMHEEIRQLELTRKDIDDIECVITNKSDGMFLYARLVLDYLSKNIFYSGKEMKSSIDELPEELTEFYRKILTQILVHLDPRSVQRIKSIFSWIAFAKRPLKRMEFLSALTFSSGDPTVNSIVPKYVLDTCGALVEERPDTTLTFIHISVKEFLQSPTSNLVILETEALAQHCVSTLTCLLSGVDIFLEEETEYHKKALRVVKGFHGLHVYATEYWTEYLLQQNGSTSFAIEHPEITKLASELAQRLSKNVDTQEISPQTHEYSSMDIPPGLIAEESLLKRCLDRTLSARSLKQLENNLFHEIKQDTNPENNPETIELSTPKSSTKETEEDNVSKMLSAYQEVVRFLLKQDQYPGISADDLEQFKSQFQSSAFTCRLSFCPRATVGFLSEELRRQHEIAHTQLSICTIPECKYPPFPSSKALESHIRRHHSPRPTRPSIRRVGNIPSNRSWMNTTGDQGWRGSETSNTDAKGPKDADYDVSSHLLRKPPGEAHQQGEPFGHREKPPTERLRDSQLIAQSGGGKSFKSTNQFPIRDDAIGYLGCALPGCGMKLSRMNLEDPFIDGALELVSLHYWNWHHADSMARCALSTCQTILPSRGGLQRHYEKKHTTLFCSRCDANHPEGFALKRELRFHWRTHHLKLSKRWKCVDVERLDIFLGGGLDYRRCEPCTDEHKYDRISDALKHLRGFHLRDRTGIQGKTLSTDVLRDYVKELWVYHEVDGEATGEGNEDMVASDNESDEEESSAKVDDMFYVEGLA